MTARSSAEFAVVGGGPAGAALAIELRALGREVVVFERTPRPRWRACGVYSSPLTRRRLRALGLAEDELERLIRPVSAMVIHPPAGAPVRLAYPAPLHACGLDRVRLDRALLDLARAAGAEVREASTVREVDLGSADGGRSNVRRPRLLVADGAGSSWWEASLIVGADGPGSLVARSAGVAVPARRLRRAGLTVHRADPAAAPRSEPMEAHMFVADGWYCGVAPVPGGRVNVGLVLGEETLRRELEPAGGVGAVVRRYIDRLPVREPWQTAPATDEAMVALPLAHRTSRAAGDGFVLVGDAAGFVDPLSGEGVHRALVSASLAAVAIENWSRGDRRALLDYDRRLRARFRNKDVVSWVLQAFLAQPAVVGYALRHMGRSPRLARTFALALADLVPASRVLDPRFLGRLLAP